jgi:hypothetical protein
MHVFNVDEIDTRLKTFPKSNQLDEVETGDKRLGLFKTVIKFNGKMV